MDSTRRLQQLIPATSEAAYDRLTCYRFASDTSRERRGRHRLERGELRFAPSRRNGQIRDSIDQLFRGP